jgi:hypothetical protein
MIHISTNYINLHIYTFSTNKRASDFYLFLHILKTSFYNTVIPKVLLSVFHNVQKYYMSLYTINVSNLTFLHSFFEHNKNMPFLFLNLSLMKMSETKHSLNLFTLKSPPTPHNCSIVCIQ